MAKAGALLMVACVLTLGVYYGLVLATWAWDEHPEFAWVGLVCAFGAAYLLADQRRHRRARPVRDDDEGDDDGGLRVRVPGPREPPPPDWAAFDDARRSWERQPAGV